MHGSLVPSPRRVSKPRMSTCHIRGSNARLPNEATEGHEHAPSGAAAEAREPLLPAHGAPAARLHGGDDERGRGQRGCDCARVDECECARVDACDPDERCCRSLPFAASTQMLPTMIYTDCPRGGTASWTAMHPRTLAMGRIQHSAMCVKKGEAMSPDVRTYSRYCDDLLLKMESFFWKKIGEFG